MRIPTRLCSAVAVLALAACSTTQNVAGNAPSRPIKSACLAIHGGNASDTDLIIQQHIQARGISVLTAATCDPHMAGVDMTVNYTAEWKWDLVMYLRAIYITFYGAPSGNMIATGNWKNSPLHQFPITETVVGGVADEMLDRSGATPTLHTGNTAP